MSSSGAQSGASVANLNALTAAAIQAGVVNAGDLAQSALGITGGTGAQAFTLAAASPCYVLAASGVLTPVTVTAGAKSITPASLPASARYAVIGLELTSSGTFAAVKGTDTVTQLNTGSLIAANTPAVTSGNMRFLDIAYFNNAGTFQYGDQTTVATKGVNWIDRRPWARGINWQTLITAGNYSLTSATLTAIDTTRLQVRMECSGVPLLVSLQSSWNNVAGSTASTWAIFQDGASVYQQEADEPTASLKFLPNLTCMLAPAAGSHLFSYFWAGNAANAMTLWANATNPLSAFIQEQVAQNVTNGAA